MILPPKRTKAPVSKKTLENDYIIKVIDGQVNFSVFKPIKKAELRSPASVTKLISFWRLYSGRSPYYHYQKSPTTYQTSTLRRSFVNTRDVWRDKFSNNKSRLASLSSPGSISPRYADV